MSWHLSDEEIIAIQSQWTACKARSDSTIAKAWNTVRALFPADEKRVQAATATASACAEPAPIASQVASSAR